MRWTVLAALCTLLLSTTLHADDASTGGVESPLVAAASACPVSLAQALERAHGAERRPLRAELVLDTDGTLLARAWVRVVEKKEASFQAWTGPLSRSRS